MRPPIVRRSSGTPSRGQLAPRCAGDLEVARVAAAPAGSARRSWPRGGDGGAGPPAGRQGPARTGRVDPGPPQDLVGQQVADPRHPALVEEPGLHRCGARRPARSAAADGVSASASGPRRSSTGSSSTPPRRRGSTTSSEPPPSKHEGEADPGRVEPARRVLEALDGGPAVDEEPTGHPEAQAQGGAVGVHQQELADPAGVEDGGAPQGRPQPGRRRRALEVPVVGRADLADRAPDHLVGSRAGTAPPRSSRARGGGSHTAGLPQCAA